MLWLLLDSVWALYYLPWQRFHISRKQKDYLFLLCPFFVFHWTLLFLTGVVNIVNALQWNKKMRKSKSKTWAKDTPYIPILELELFTCSSNITSKEGDSIWMVSHVSYLESSFERLLLLLMKINVSWILI